jgi:type II secretory pathway component PulM
MGRTFIAMSRLKAWLGVAVVLVGFYVTWKIVPPFFNNMQFEDAMGEEAKLSAYALQRTEQDIKEAMAKKAIDYDIPLTAEQIHVTRNSSELTISADYTVHVDLPIHPIDLEFHPSSKGKRI